MNNGLLRGLADGLNSGIQSYGTERNRREELAVKLAKQKQDAEMHELGLLEKGVRRVDGTYEPGAGEQVTTIGDSRFAFKPGSSKEGRDAAKLNFDQTTELGKEYLNLPTTKDSQQVAASYAKIKEAAQNPSAAGDLALIFNYMRLLDPGSTVREGEFANAQNAAGVPDRIANMYNRVMRGERLNPDQRLDFTSQAGGLVRAQHGRQKAFSDQYTTRAQKFGLDPSQVLIDPFSGVEIPKAAIKKAMANPEAPESKGIIAAIKDAAVTGAKKVGLIGEATAASKPKTVTQNGVTYTLNERTGEYE